jgi:YVTN family beta-propeller protein
MIHHTDNSISTLMKSLIYVLVLLCLPAFAAHAAGESFVTFESGQVRPVVLSPNGNYLFAVNTPDNRLEIFRVTNNGLLHTGSLPVGMEPVAVAARNNREVWVVNHLSDSISIVDIGAGTTIPPRVKRTLLVGDEPRDIVFAGPGGNRAFITTAHRGQNSPANIEPQKSIARADVWVFDAADPGASLGGDPLTIVELFGDTPRALAVSPDGGTVYAGIFNSGNQTTVLSTGTVKGDMPPPLTNIEGADAPATSLIAKFNGTDWLDGAGRVWTNLVRSSLPDYDVFAIDANLNPPAEVEKISGVGTILFNMAVNPANGNIFVSNLEARNDVRFEGPGVFGGSTVRGHIAENQITIIDDNTGVPSPRHLNKHIDYGQFPGTPDENTRSLAFPLDMAFTNDGAKVYVAAFGSSKVGIFDTGELGSDTFEPGNNITVSGGGPSGLALDETRNRLYVFTRFDNSISIIDTNTNQEVSHLPIYNPEPASVVDGRRFLYDASYTSSRGDSACATCHIFGDKDELAWDLGNPDDVVADNPNPFVNPVSPDADPSFHPMKGPMTTQSFRGMANHGPMHWRGDRTGGHLPGGDPMDEDAAFKAFNGAFEGLIGRTAPLTEAEMQAFTDFALQITYPPNPIRALDNSLTTLEAVGRNFYFNVVTTADGEKCNDCHTLDPENGFFGTQGLSLFSDRLDAQPLKIPHLRNLYTKMGFNLASAKIDLGVAVSAPQIRGFGYVHDGSTDNLFNFLNNPRFNFPGGDIQRRGVMGFLLAIDSNLAPVVGQQITLTSTNAAVAKPRIDLLVARSAQQPAPECDLIVKGVLAGQQRGWYRTTGGYRSDRSSEPLIPRRAIERYSAASGETFTFTCTPPGSGVRMGVDRDEDGFYDRDELDAGSDPADPLSIPL